MRSLITIISICSFLLAGQVAASTPSCLVVREPATLCNNTEGSSNIKRGNNAAFALVPFPVRIVSVTMANNASPLTAGQSGIWQIWLDPNSAYANANPGYPYNQQYVPMHSILADMELQPGLPMHVTRDLTFPLDWDAADSIVIDMPCNHPPGQPDFAAAMWWDICWIKP